MEPLSDRGSDSKLSNGALIKRLLAMSWRYKLGCVKILCLQALLLFIALAGLSFTGIGIDYIRNRIEPASPAAHWPFGWLPPASWDPMAVIGLLAGGVLLFAVCRGFLNYHYTVAMAQLLQGRIVVDLRATVYNKLQRLSFRFFDDNASGTIINRVTRDVQATRLFIDGVIFQSVIMLLSLVSYVLYMLHIHVWLTIACLATTPLLWICTTVFSRIVRPAYNRNNDLYDKMVLVLSESVQGIQVLKGFAREPEARERFRVANAEVRDQKWWIIRWVSGTSASVGFLTQVNLIVLLAYGGYLVINHSLPLGTGLVVFAGLLQQFSGQVANASNLANSIQESLSGARRVFQVLDAPVEITNRPSAVALPAVKGAVRFENVSFGYDPADLVLHDITLEVAAGQCVAILGTTGSGKSTLMSLIPRFYDPVKGCVRVDGVDVRDCQIDDLRRHVGIVFQENFLFSNTIASNIAFGCPDATAADIERAARIASAHDFIMAMPKGYETVLGEGGADVSGGQRQRISIARAILLEPSILLLDDPTAAIDPETEQDIMEAMDHAMEGRTTFVVAHRLSTLRRADRILVLEKGRIVQSGTHEQLMAAKGPYRGVAMLQVVDDESLKLLEGLDAAEGKTA